MSSRKTSRRHTSQHNYSYMQWTYTHHIWNWPKLKSWPRQRCLLLLKIVLKATARAIRQEKKTKWIKKKEIKVFLFQNDMIDHVLAFIIWEWVKYNTFCKNLTILEQTNNNIEQTFREINVLSCVLSDICYW